VLDWDRIGAVQVVGLNVGHELGLGHVVEPSQGDLGQPAKLVMQYDLTTRSAVLQELAASLLLTWVSIFIEERDLVAVG
jgi:hypothetical protein